MPTVQQLIQQYALEPHPEGGWYRETYRSQEIIPATALPERYGGSRSFATTIFFLLEKGNFSAFHRIKSDECWHFYAGDPLLVYIIENDGSMTMIELGADTEKGQLFQYVVLADRWFASRPAADSQYCFTGCTVSPGFEFADFELADADSLSQQYPEHETIIRSLCW